MGLIYCFILLVLLCCSSILAQGPDCRIETIAGFPTTYQGDGGPAVDAEFAELSDVAIDAVGFIYAADSRNHVVRRFRPGGMIETVAGTGIPGYSGDGGPAVSAQLYLPVTVAVDPDGNLYIGERGNFAIRKVTPDGVISTLAGGRRDDTFTGGWGDGGPSTEAWFTNIYDIVVDQAGNVYVADAEAARVRRIDPNGIITTVAGRGYAPGAGQARPADDSDTATHVQLQLPRNLAVDPSGTLYISDNVKRLVYRLAEGKLTPVAGNGGSEYVGDDLPATENGIRPSALLIDAEGNLLIVDGVSSARIRRVDLNGIMTTVAAFPADSLALAPDGQLYRASLDIISRWAPGGDPEYVAGQNARQPTEDGAPAIQARLFVAADSGIAVDSRGAVYFAESLRQRIRRVNPDGTLETVAGEALARRPAGIFIDGDDNLYAVDYSNYRIRKRTPAGTVTTVCGGGSNPFGNGKLATDVICDAQRPITGDSAGNLYFAADHPATLWKLSAEDGRVYRVDRLGSHSSRATSLAAEDSGIVHALVDTDFVTFSPEGRNTHPLRYFTTGATAVAVDRSGNLYAGDWRIVKRTTDYRIWKHRPDGIFDRIAGFDRTPIYFADGHSSEVSLGSIGPMAVGPNGDVFFIDFLNRRVRKISASGCSIEGRPAIADVLSSAVGGWLAAGSLFSLYGARLGPEEPAYAELDERGRVAKQAGGTRIFFNGVAAPLTYAQDGQINGAVPFDVWGRREATVTVESNGVRSEFDVVFLRPAAPAVFAWYRDGRQYAAMINQDGTLNGPDNPAPPGSVVTIFATGAGQTTPGGVDGQIAGLPLPKPIQPVAVEIGVDTYAEVLYAGAAPGLMEGVLQVNFRVPEGEGGVTSFRLMVGDYKLTMGVYFVVE